MGEGQQQQHQQQQQQSGGGPLSNRNTVFIGNIAFDIPEQNIKKILGIIGPIKAFLQATDKQSGAKKGYAFCEYHNQLHATAAINTLDQLELRGRRIKVDSAHGAKKMDDDGGEYDKNRISAETKKEIENALKKLTMSEVYDIVSEMKMLIQRDRDHAYNLLQSKPVLAQALLTAQLMLGMGQYAGSHVQASSSSSSSSSSHVPMMQDDDFDEEEALKRRIMALTPEEIAQLTPEEQERIHQIRNQLEN